MCASELCLNDFGSSVKKLLFCWLPCGQEGPQTKGILMIDNLAATDDAQHLTVTWTTGEESVLSAEMLRQEARDAWSIRERLDHGSVAVLPGIRITGLQQIGNGVNVHFSDGHEKAIYPFPFLRELSQRFDK